MNLYGECQTGGLSKAESRKSEADEHENHDSAINFHLLGKVRLADGFESDGVASRGESPQSA
jgi:hypothetical protein